MPFLLLHLVYLYFYYTSQIFLLLHLQIFLLLHVFISITSCKSSLLLHFANLSSIQYSVLDFRYYREQDTSITAPLQLSYRMFMNSHSHQSLMTSHSMKTPLLELQKSKCETTQRNSRYKFCS